MHGKISLPRYLSANVIADLIRNPCPRITRCAADPRQTQGATPSSWSATHSLCIYQHALTWDGKTAELDIDALKATAAYYRIQPEDAQTPIDQVRAVVTSWRDKARALQLPGTEIQAMENVFAV